MTLISLNVLAQESKKEHKEQKKIERYQQIKDLVNSGQYEFKGLKANPQKGSQIALSSRFNFLKVNGATQPPRCPTSAKLLVAEPMPVEMGELISMAHEELHY